MEKARKVEHHRQPRLLGICVLALLAVCGQRAEDTVAALSEASAPASIATQAAAQVALAEGMAYADLRNAVLDEGWKPKVDAQCKVNVVGANFAELCKSSPDQCKVCDQVPELSSCSGDGHCMMYFERGNGEALAVSTYGEIADWNVSGKASRLTVKWWDPEFIKASVGK